MAEEYYCPAKIAHLTAEEASNCQSFREPNECYSGFNPETNGKCSVILAAVKKSKLEVHAQSQPSCKSGLPTRTMESLELEEENYREYFDGIA